jgi:hypothetical protein
MSSEAYRWRSRRLVEQLIARVRAEYLQRPGLALTKEQMRRYWVLDASACDTIVAALVASGFLHQRADHAFVRQQGDVRS